MGATVRQKIKGKGKPWWVFIAHDDELDDQEFRDKNGVYDEAEQAV